MLKNIIKRFIPLFLLKILRKIREKILMRKFKKLKLRQVFEKIYNEKIWTPEIDKKKI